MKTFRKLIPALGMLLISALMLTTASFAWFAMQTDVTAENMKVNIRTDSPFLLIVPHAESTDYTTALTVAQVQAEQTAENPATSATGAYAFGQSNDSSVNLAPVKHGTITAANSKLAAAEANWQTFYAESSAASAAQSDATGTNVGSSSTDYVQGYVVRYTYFLAMAKGSDAASNLDVKEVSVTTTAQHATPIRVMIVCGTNVIEYENKKVKSNTEDTAEDKWVRISSDESKKLADSVSATGNDNAQVVNIYVYYNGEHGDVFSDNIANLGDATVTVKLGVDKQAAADSQ